MVFILFDKRDFKVWLTFSLTEPVFFVLLEVCVRELAARMTKLIRILHKPHAGRLLQNIHSFHWYLYNILLCLMF